ncbi:MAG: IclR family transcriptional regulator [Propionibacteriaceae bacterium]|nr:IclR family transcriptional regulator [Propionibacteriaceae bacterium]
MSFDLAPDSPVAALDRGLRALEALSQAGPDGLELRQLAEQLALHKSTLHRALTALKLRGYVVQDPVSGTYRLGPTAVRLGDDYLRREDLPALLAPALRALSARVDELVHLGVPNLPRMTYVAKVEPEHALRVWSQVGASAPAATTAMGRAVLSCLDSVNVAELSAVSPRPLPEPDFKALLAAARRDGYATENEENEPGISCVGMALLRRGVPVAAVSVTAPTSRMGQARIAEVVEAMRAELPGLLPPGLLLQSASS